MLHWAPGLPDGNLALNYGTALILITSGSTIQALEFAIPFPGPYPGGYPEH